MEKRISGMKGKCPESTYIVVKYMLLKFEICSFFLSAVMEDLKW